MIKPNPYYHRISNRGNWEVVYTGFVLILLSFFIMLCSFSALDESKLTRFIKSFSHAVNILSGGLKTTPGPVVLPSSADMVARRHAMAALYANVKNSIQATGLAGEVTVSMAAKGVVVRFADRVLFHSGRDEILSGATGVLEKIGAVILRTSHAVRIEGHTDARPIRTARFPSNWELSTARAVNVLRFFSERMQISTARLSAAGFAEFQPVLDNRTDANRATNRRVEIIFTVSPPEDTVALSEVTFY